MASMLKLAVAWTAVSTLTCATAQSLPVVDLNYTVQRAYTFYPQYDAYEFRDVRYAAPPVGQARFRAPQPPAVNRTIQQGGQNIACTQQNGAGQEDCLFLNVFTTRNALNNATSNSSFTGLPVIVWMYGGGYVSGSKQDNIPESFYARETATKSSGIVWVQFNYRLGAFGWLSGSNFTQNGDANVGLLDQRYVLDWIQTNIKKFGGNPSQVTVMGESAGGGSIVHQVTAYGGSNGSVPFLRAIPQSPGYRPNDDTTQMNAVFQRYLQLLNVSTIDQARNLPYDSLKRASIAQVNEAYIARYPFGPVVDGKFVPDLPGKLIYQGRFDKNVQVMTGHNFNEGQGFTDSAIKTDTDFRNWVTVNLPSQVATPSKVDYVVNNMYPPIFDGSQAQNYTTQFERADAFTSELKFTCNNYWLNKAASTSYGYYFIVDNATHSQDLTFTFYVGDANATDPKGILSHTMQQYFLNFAKTGQPNGVGLANFPVYNPGSPVRVFNYSGSPTVQDPASNTRCSIFQTEL